MDWVDTEQEWLDPDEDWGASGEEWSEPDEGWDAYDEEWSDLDERGDEYEDPDQAWLDPSSEWEQPDQRAYVPVQGARVGPGFVMACALLVGALLSLVLYNATAGATFLAEVVAVGSPSGVGNGDAQGQQIASESQTTQQAEVSDVVCAVSEGFPPAILQWCDLITRYAGKHGLPPDLIAALIWQESGGNPIAYSRSGAVGLMQVMPRDGLAASFMCKNGPCFSTRPTTEELKDPEFNVAYGTKMLAGLLRRSGSLRDALRSYGPMDVGYYYADKVLGLFQAYGKQSP